MYFLKEFTQRSKCLLGFLNIFHPEESHFVGNDLFPLLLCNLFFFFLSPLLVDIIYVYPNNLCIVLIDKNRFYRHYVRTYPCTVKIIMMMIMMSLSFLLSYILLLHAAIITLSMINDGDNLTNWLADWLYIWLIRQVAGFISFRLVLLLLLGNKTIWIDSV